MRLGLIFLSGCALQFTDAPDWTDQVIASGPCYDANLLDGLDDSSTQEAHDVFACLNQTGTIDALRPLDTALDTPTRGEVVGIELAAWARVAPSAIHGWSLQDVVADLDAFLSDRDGVRWWGDIGVELLYGAAVADVSVDADLAASTRLDAGVIAPLLDPMATVCGAALDSADLRAWFADLLRGDTLGRLAWTVAAIPNSSSAPMAALTEDWADHVADALSRVQDNSNDHDAGATGNSLRDLVVLLVDPVATEGLATRLRPILEDEVAVGRLRATLSDAVASGWIDHLPGQVLRLATEDVSGDVLQAADDSALTALIRLLARANQPADCSIDLGLTEIEFSLGNLAVTLLEQLALLDADVAVDGVDLLSDVLGTDLSDAILGAIADTGVCPAIDDQLVSDLGALERLNETPELLRLLIAVLGALDDHITDIADLATVLHERGLVAPVEEVLRDLADAPIASDLTTLLPALLEPSGWYDLDELPAGADVLELEDLIAAATTGFADWPLLQPTLAAVVSQDATWTAIDHLGPLLSDPEAQVRTALTAYADWMYTTPDDQPRETLAGWIEDDTLTTPLLRVGEADGLRTALRTTDTEAEGPLPFLARLHLDGTLDDLLDTVALLRDLLGG